MDFNEDRRWTDVRGRAVEVVRNIIEFGVVSLGFLLWRVATQNIGRVQWKGEDFHK